ncbi:alanyl-tRNA editing protein [Sulfitobacter sp. M57]|uniref:alanyl-tRNA editing protein n=1 Tax=unclassified Sulfitobacter TaxID=196795 RepID=UPI0023E18305|nr:MULTISPECIES: alanyl-tRNA editing protein [unclassified Sulfitobacter]MDF3413859.1 alanyl-tRNA editing protein [Sulfitobacter sp. KE5]MDF3420860.1 alanyl-tRNA editing protein [Sulfitobacter sp. KE43]MDF3432405.1 alanyl-tRNA editing protein [Sulfitobacter sp. KE42]MDF3458044.1 alanyl-tRNA editing protein [Sulfitobacter sp. S74]MDF3461945.1 alanyl-tRNA editing protein [Sulfitobacter sp. Ks18]
MTRLLFREDTYRRDAPAMVKEITPEGGVVLDQSLFYATGGGQPGDSGWISWDGQRLPIATTVNGDDGAVVLVPAEASALPPKGAHIVQELDWDRRYKHMRVHSALHLLSAVMPFGVTGGQISATHGRLDFDMPDAPQDRDEIEEVLNELVAMDLRIGESWMTQEELEENPHLIKTMAVRPPKGAGDIRLISIGEEDDCIDLQPCGGTHVARTGEIGSLRLGKMEKKGRMNRRVYLHLDG